MQNVAIEWKNILIMLAGEHPTKANPFLLLLVNVNRLRNISITTTNRPTCGKQWLFEHMSNDYHEISLQIWILEFL
jgi:hypothetical protein